jgi:hypothetical protein
MTRRRRPDKELSRAQVRLLLMTVAPEILYALGAFALAGGRICGGVQWHRWHRQVRRTQTGAPSSSKI